MSEATRPYRSALRDDQARATRRRIVDAGAELFVASGYASTTIDAIAARAGVSRKTVFTSVGGKVAVLKLAFDWTLAGDDEPVAIADRADVLEMMQLEDSAALLASWIAMNASIAARIAEMHHVLVVAADVDPDAARLLASSDQQRLDGARAVASRLHAIGGVRSDLDVDSAAAILDVLIDPMPYRRLVALRGWTSEAYEQYQVRMAAAAVLA
jgi:AcrR family transcriptional regulator